MFYSLTGTILKKDLNYAAIDVNGAGFLCYVSYNTLTKLGPVGSKATLYTYMSVRQDAIELYGFYDEKELDVFKLLLNVSGVGNKVALSVLSSLTPESLARAVNQNDYKTISKAQGIGAKGAQRICMELKGKLKAYSDSAETDDNIPESGSVLSSNAEEAVRALLYLGYTQSDAVKIVSGLDKNLSVEEMIKKALSEMDTLI